MTMISVEWFQLQSLFVYVGNGLYLVSDVAVAVKCGTHLAFMSEQKSLETKNIQFASIQQTLPAYDFSYAKDIL